MGGYGLGILRARRVGIAAPADLGHQVAQPARLVPAFQRRTALRLVEYDVVTGVVEQRVNGVQIAITGRVEIHQHNLCARLLQCDAVEIRGGRLVGNRHSHGVQAIAQVRGGIGRLVQQGNGHLLVGIRHG